MRNGQADAALRCAKVGAMRWHGVARDLDPRCMRMPIIVAWAVRMPCAEAKPPPMPGSQPCVDCAGGSISDPGRVRCS